jgi:hypothetical protein
MKLDPTIQKAIPMPCYQLEAITVTDEETGEELQTLKMEVGCLIPKLREILEGLPDTGGWDAVEKAHTYESLLREIEELAYPPMEVVR